ncbi:hypothetical protein DWZ52_09520 [Collinsella sp. AF33-16]|nr:hypothetical protein DXD56_05595 [Collinsella sp. TM06-3]RHM59445.1 hypothetical protein DWZ52_09520 [Collinsella sp. AF33-16]
MFDAFSLLADLMGRAEREVALVDGYADVHTPNIPGWQTVKATIGLKLGLPQYLALQTIRHLYF